MEKFEPRLSFGILCSRDFFEKLEDEYKDFDRNHLSPRHAINCALTSWHLTDWTYSEFFKDDPRFQEITELTINNKKVSKSGIAEFQKYIIGKCPELKYMRMISNGSKHCILKNSSIKEKTKINEGDFNFYEYNRHEYNVDEFVIETNDNLKISFEGELIKTIQFWRDFITKQELK